MVFFFKQKTAYELRISDWSSDVCSSDLAVLNDDSWSLIRRTDGRVHKKVKARDLWDRISYAAWSCADPGMQYDTTINEWHRSEEHTSELQSLMRISYAVFCLKKKKNNTYQTINVQHIE